MRLMHGHSGRIGRSIEYFAARAHERIRRHLTEFLNAKRKRTGLHNLQLELLSTPPGGFGNPLPAIRSSAAMMRSVEVGCGPASFWASMMSTRIGLSKARSEARLLADLRQQRARRSVAAQRLSEELQVQLVEQLKLERDGAHAAPAGRRRR